MFEIILRNGLKLQVQAAGRRQAMAIVRREFKFAPDDIDMLTRIY